MDNQSDNCNTDLNVSVVCHFTQIDFSTDTAQLNGDLNAIMFCMK